MTSIESKLVLTDFYDLELGIKKPDDVAKPMSSVLYHEEEDTVTSPELNALIRQYNNNKIYDYYHLTFMEYLELPRSITLVLAEQAEKMILSKGSDSGLSDDLKKLEKELQD